ncbi:nucleotidyltransferase domain-containing protein [Bacillus salipaludis]|uniref:Nucleotidyltransferase domain-containing protein n=1 Tax=Bacillus salipaludis TaxID=2547811 RepID=A0ABW8RGV8_9BACI
MDKNFGKEIGTVETQLNILREINEICLSQNFLLWLRGGWAIDFLLGKITRLHSDIDLVTWIQYRERLEQAMVNSGFKKIPVSEFQTDFLKNDIDVSFVFVRLSDDGNIIANGFPDWVWRKDALPMLNYHLQGISINVLSPHQLLEEKKVYEQGTGRKLRPKDLESIKIIQEIIDALN